MAKHPPLDIAAFGVAYKTGQGLSADLLAHKTKRRQVFGEEAAAQTELLLHGFILEDGDFLGASKKSRLRHLACDQIFFAELTQLRRQWRRDKKTPSASESRLGCPHCAKNRRHTRDDLDRALASLDLSLVSACDAVTNKTPITVKCHRAHDFVDYHEFSTTLGMILAAIARAGTVCPDCSRHGPKAGWTPARLMALLKTKDMSLNPAFLLPADLGIFSRIFFICVHGTPINRRLSEIRDGRGCKPGACYPSRRGQHSRPPFWTVPRLTGLLNDKGISLDPSFVLPADLHQRSRIHFICADHGKSIWRTFGDLTRGKICRLIICYPKVRDGFQASTKELAIFEQVRLRYPDAICGEYGRIPSYPAAQADGYIPSLRLGWDFNGVYFHRLPAAKDRDARKQDACKRDGILWFVIDEAEMDRNPKVTLTKFLASIARADTPRRRALVAQTSANALPSKAKKAA